MLHQPSKQLSHDHVFDLKVTFFLYYYTHKRANYICTQNFKPATNSADTCKYSIGQSFILHMYMYTQKCFTRY